MKLHYFWFDGDADKEKIYILLFQKKWTSYDIVELKTYIVYTSLIEY